jgi:hypothetical protein
MRKGKSEQMEIASDEFIISKTVLEHQLSIGSILREDYESKLKNVVDEYYKRLATILSWDD